MINTFIGTKQEMSQAWTVDGYRIPVTLVKAGPLVVTQVKSSEKDGYDAIQIGYGGKKVKNTTKPLLGHLAKALKSQAPGTKSQTVPRYLREVKISEEHMRDGRELKVGDEINAPDVLSVGDLVKVTGISKGKGFAGVVKRWGFHGGPRTHGQSDRERAPGSIGQTTTPGRVMRGKKMAGRMGGERATVRNLTVVDVNEEVIKLSGPVPGSVGSIVYIEKIGHDEKFKMVAKSENEVPQEEETKEVEKEEELKANSQKRKTEA